MLKNTKLKDNNGVQKPQTYALKRFLKVFFLVWGGGGVEEVNP